MNPIEAHDLTKQFGKLTAVDNLDLQIAQGEFFGFIGPNGAGKDHHPANAKRPAPTHLWHSHRTGYRCRRRPYRSKGGGIAFLCTHILELAEKLCNRMGLIEQEKPIAAQWSPVLEKRGIKEDNLFN